ncbi:hypothetical protein B7463_g2387, partial [Scytalidium lignicola]
MAFGVLEDYNLSHVPGTVNLTDRNEVVEGLEDLKKLGEITLVPQPSDSPNDPLNWSPWKKNTLLFVVALTSGVTTSLGPMISPGLLLLSARFGKSLDTVSTFLVGLFLLWTGIFTFFTSAAASVWGKRVVFLMSGLALLAFNAWGFYAKPFSEFVAMRLMQGFASAPFETLVTSSIQDIFFVHERGKKLAIWGSMITAGVFLGQVISGVIIQNLGIPYTFGICALIFIPLTTLPKISELSITAVDSDKPPKRRYSELAVFRGRVSDVSFWGQVVLPFPLFLYPAVIFGSFVYGTFFAFLVALSVVSVPLFSAPPYNLTPSQVGLTNIPLLFAGLLGAPISGWMADWVIRTMAKRNNGTYEPEFRLTLMAVGGALSIAGFAGLGISAEMGAPIAYPLAFESLQSLAVPFASQAAYAYVTDCHPVNANQAFVTIGLVKAILTFISTTFINGWFETQGPKTVFLIIAAINFGLVLLTIPMYVFGKRFRSLVARRIQTEVPK